MLATIPQLRDEPFGVTPDPRFLFLGPAHREALASLIHGIQSGRGFLTLIAEPGMGKTTLLFRLLEYFRETAQTVFIFQTQCNSRELLSYLLADIGVDHRGADIVSLHEQFNNVLLKLHHSGKRFILVIDEAQNLSAEVLETVRLLSDFETPRAKLLQIVLAGQPQFAEMLKQPSLSQLRQRISMFCRLRPLSARETQRYIQHRLTVAGYSGPPLFSDTAIESVVSHSGGVPRNINNLCFASLDLARAVGAASVDRHLVEEAARDLHWTSLIDDSPAGELPAEEFEDDLPIAPHAPSGEEITPVDFHDSLSSRTGFQDELQIQNENGFAQQEYPIADLETAGRDEGDQLLERFRAVVPIPETERSHPGPAQSKKSDTRSSTKLSRNRRDGSNIDKRTTVLLSIAVLICVLLLMLRPASRIFAGLGNDPPPQPSQQAASPPQPTSAEVASDLPEEEAKKSPPLKRSAQLNTSDVASNGSPTKTDQPVANQAVAQPDSRPNARMEASQESQVGSTNENEVVVKNRIEPAVVPPMSDSQPSAVPPDDIAPPPPNLSGVNSSNNNSIAGIFPTLSTPIAIAPESAPEATAAATTARTSSGVVPGKLIASPPPVYPAPARAAGVEGDVVLTAVIRKDGKLRDVRVLSGHAYLALAAVEAVRRWRYTPYQLNGEPTEVETLVTVKFKR